MLEYAQPGYFSSRSSNNTYDFTIIYKTISHAKLKDGLKELVQLCFIRK
jgi:hypothetical protein